MKKLGKAKIDLEKNLWTNERETAFFDTDRRLVETRPDVKKFMARFKKILNAPRPGKRDAIKREEFFGARDEARRQRDLFFARVYADLLKESHLYPIPLKKDHDYDHNGEWRFCLYKGNIYQFDAQNLSHDAMIQQIEAYENRLKPATEPASAPESPVRPA